MTEDNRMPHFWWCPTHHLYRGGDERPCADAVRLVPAPPAPRVFFPGDTVPGDVPMACLVNTDEGQFVGLLEAGNVDFELSKHVGPVIELRDVPSIEEWQAAVDRAHAALGGPALTTDAELRALTPGRAQDLMDTLKVGIRLAKEQQP